MNMGRRVFVRGGALALMALGLPPDFLMRPLLARTRGAERKKTLICIFQRGAVDGLNMVVPFGDEGYYEGRTTIAVPRPSRGATEGVALDLDGHFGLHPEMRALMELYQRSEMAIVHAVGSPHPSRSHFDAQEFMELGTPGEKNTPDGWLNRVLQETDCSDCRGRTLADGAAHEADHTIGQVGMGAGDAIASLRGIAMGSSTPVALKGAHPSLAIPDLTQFGVAGSGTAESALERMYRTEFGDAVTSAAHEAFEAVGLLESLNPGAYRPANGAQYPAGEFGRSLQQIAQLVKAEVGVEVAFADIGGWDTHANQGGAQGQLARNLAQLSNGIAALHRDLGDRMDDVVILTMSEFGRTVRQNGTGGTDHGHANCMLVLGGAVAGGQVLGDWPGLDRDQLYEGRDLAVTTDFRDVFAEIVDGHLGAERLDRIFPGHELDPARYRGVLR